MTSINPHALASRAEPVPDGDEAIALTTLRAALARHRATGEVAAVEAGLEAARALVAARPELHGPPDVPALRALALARPEFGELLTCAAREAARAVGDAHRELWSSLGLRSPAPSWSDEEHEAARTLFACACSPSAAAGPDAVPAALRRLSAAPLAGALVVELGRDEAVWRRALGERYESLRHRCAPRTMLRSRGLCDLIREDRACRAAVEARLERWVSAGAGLEALAAELEAAVVHARTPSRLA